MTNIKTLRGDVPKTKKLSPETLAYKVLETLNGLQKINPLVFQEWFEQGYSKTDALSKPVEYSLGFIKNIIEKEWDNKFPELGTSFEFWNDDNNIERSIDFIIGVTSSNENLTNNIAVSLSIGFEEDELELIKKLLKDTWEIQNFSLLDF